MTTFCVILVGVFLGLYLSQGRRPGIGRRVRTGLLSKRDIVRVSHQMYSSKQMVGGYSGRVYLSASSRLYRYTKTGSVRFLSYRDGVLLLQASYSVKHMVSNGFGYVLAMPAMARG